MERFAVLFVALLSFASFRCCSPNLLIARIFAEQRTLRIGSAMIEHEDLYHARLVSTLNDYVTAMRHKMPTHCVYVSAWYWSNRETSTSNRDRVATSASANNSAV